MIKRSQHSLKFITAKKRQLLDTLFIEYQRVVNEFIVLYWDKQELPKNATAVQWRAIPSWLCGKTVKCAYRQAIQMIQSTRAKDRKLVYKSYQRVYAYAKRRNKNWPIVTQK